MLYRLMALILLISPLPALANPQLCAAAASRAAAATGVPEDVLLAITLTETGRTVAGRFAPWPWTVNADGQGYWFASRAEALAFARAAQARGQTNIDLGCFQINYRWHGAQFSSLDAMFDPDTAALYAARLLARRYRETSDWSEAAGAYHSRTARLATRYRTRFDEVRRTLIQETEDFGASRVVQAAAPAELSADRQVRANWFPLLRPGRGSGRLGSLVPLGG